MTPKIIIDTREKMPWCFPADEYEIECHALPEGDYRLDNTGLVVERKTLDDFVSTVIRQWDRFHAELIRLRKYDDPWVIVEADMKDLYAQAYRSKAFPLAVMGRAAAIKYMGINVFFAGDRVRSIDWFRARIADRIKKDGEKNHG